MRCDDKMIELIIQSIIFNISSTQRVNRLCVQIVNSYKKQEGLCAKLTTTGEWDKGQISIENSEMVWDGIP